MTNAAAGSPAPVPIPLAAPVRPDAGLPEDQHRLVALVCYQAMLGRGGTLTVPDRSGSGHWRNHLERMQGIRLPCPPDGLASSSPSREDAPTTPTRLAIPCGD